MNEQFASSVIGVSGLAFAVVNTQGNKTTKPTYGTIYHCNGLVGMSPDPEQEAEVSYLDNDRWRYIPSKINIEKTSLTPTLQNLMLGKTLTNGLLQTKLGDTAPFIAILWEEVKANGKRVRKCVPMARITSIKVHATTKTDDIEFTHAELSGEYIHTLNGIKMLECDEESGCTKFSTWYDSVPI